MHDTTCGSPLTTLHYGALAILSLDQSGASNGVVRRRACARTLGWTLCTTLGAALCLLLGCGTHNQGDLDANGQKPDPQGNGQTPSGATRLKLDPETLSVLPGETQPFNIVVSPAGVYTLQASLFGTEGAAFLDTDRPKTNSQGEAQVVLTVASESSDLRLLVAVGNLESEAQIQVRPILRGNLLVLPEYPGRRPLDGWDVSVQPSVDCADLSLEAPPEAGFRFNKGAPLLVERQAAERPLTVFVRSKQYVFGCRQGVVLKPNQENVVAITALDRPLQLTGIDLQLKVGMQPSGTLRAEVTRVLERMVQAFAPSGNDEDALREALFAAAKNQKLALSAEQVSDWTARLKVFLGPSASRGLTDILRGWLLSGSERFFSDPLFIGQLQATDSAPGRAWFRLSTVAGLAPRQAGMPDTYLASLVAGPDDHLRAAIAFQFQPSKLFAELAESALPEAPDLEGAKHPLPARLAAALDCQGLGNALTLTPATSLDPAPLVDEAACGQSCAAARVCEAALVDMWQAASSADLGPASIELLAGGRSDISDAAMPIGFSGQWVGEVVFPGAVSKAEGPFNAQPPGSPAN